MLERFGFTPTEGKIYQALLRLGPSTGYAVAREVGVARANVYQALESLARRGASRKSATIPVQYAAAGPAALLSELDRSFRRDLSELQEELRSLPLAGSSGTTELEYLTSAPQLLSRAASCVDAASSEVLAVTGPWAEPLNARFAFAAARRVTVRAVSLGESPLEGALARPVSPDQLKGYWGGQPVVVVADRGRAVVGVLSGETASGLATSAIGIVPFIRHLLRRELA
jgi:sugar-specific transcriptional regulator TrmB